MKIKIDDVAEFLKENPTIGFFFAPEPLKTLKSADGSILYKINEIHGDNFLSKFTEYMNNKEIEEVRGNGDETSV